MQRLVLSLPNATLSASADAQLIEQGDNFAIIDASRVALLHGMESGQYYRSGHNSWSPSGWNLLSEAPCEFPDERRTTADDPGADDAVRHHGSWMGAVVEEEGGAGFIGALAGGHPKVRADEDVFVGFDEIRPARWFVSWGSEAEIFEAYVEQLRLDVAAPVRHRVCGVLGIPTTKMFPGMFLPDSFLGLQNLVSLPCRSMMAGS